MNTVIDVLVPGSPATRPLSVRTGVVHAPDRARALAAAHGVAEEDAVLAFLHAAAANMVSAAIRLVPLGQSAGLRVQAALEATLLGVARNTVGACEADLGGAAWGAEIASMRHETQYTRLFRS